MFCEAIDINLWSRYWYRVQCIYIYIYSEVESFLMDENKFHFKVEIFHSWYYWFYKILSYLEYSKFDLRRFFFLLIRYTRNSNSIYFTLIVTRFPSWPVSNDTNTIHESASPSKAEFVLILSCQWVATSSPQKRDERLSSCLFNQDSTANVTVSLFPSLSSVTT